MGFAEDVRETIRRAATEAGSGHKLAAKHGMNQSTISRWLSAKRNPISEIGRLMDALGVTLSTSPAPTPAQASCPELEAECARLRRIVAEQEIRLDELRALLRPAGMEEPAKKEKAG